MKPVQCFVSAVLAAVVCAGAPSVGLAADEYGTITGQFVLKGDIPEPEVVIKKGAAIKDAAICAANDHTDQSLVVDPETKGIRDIFVYMPKAPKNIHPDLKESKEKEVVFDQQACQFIPRALFVRTDQTVVVKSNDAVSHNTHTYPVTNQGENFILPPMNRDGRKVTFKGPERIPINVVCDIHSWMLAHWLILDHPYATVSAEDGKFTIEKVPAGEQTFYFWQERSGYIKDGKERAWKVKVENGQTADLGTIEVPIEVLKVAKK